MGGASHGDAGTIRHTTSSHPNHVGLRADFEDNLHQHQIDMDHVIRRSMQIRDRSGDNWTQASANPIGRRGGLLVPHDEASREAHADEEMPVLNDAGRGLVGSMTAVSIHVYRDSHKNLAYLCHLCHKHFTSLEEVKSHLKRTDAGSHNLSKSQIKAVLRDVYKDLHLEK